MLEENKKVELNEEQVEDVDGGLLAEAGLAAAMIFGQVSPVMAEMNPTPEVQETTQQASTIALSNDNVQLVNTLTENGSLLTQEVKVVVNGIELQKDKEYTVTNNTALSAGTYTLTVEGKDMYSGKIDVDFTVQATDQKGFGSGVYANPEDPAEQVNTQAEAQPEQQDTNQDQQLGAILDIKDCTVEAETLTYNGSPQVPTITVTTQDGTVLTAGTDYEVNTDEVRQQEVGTYNFTVYGLGSYKDTTATGSFTINAAPVEKKDISQCTVNVAQATYNGSPQLPDVTVTDAQGNVLKAGTDYELNTQEARQQNVGTYAFTIVGGGDYDGTSTTANFTIAQATLGDDNVKLSENLVYNKKEQTQKVTVTFNGMTLTEGTDYEVTNNKATNKGNYTLTVTGKGNFAGTVNKTFTIYSEKEAVKTGENTNIGLYAAMAGAAVAMFGGLFALNKKRSKR